jgi:hypothetical protein
MRKEAMREEGEEAVGEQEKQSTICMLCVTVILRKFILINFIQSINQQTPRRNLPQVFFLFLI